MFRIWEVVSAGFKNIGPRMNTNNGVNPWVKEMIRPLSFSLLFDSRAFAA
jgi:hypothetical protein